MTGTKLKLLALEVASKAHRSQTRWGGEPYLIHPVRVATRVAEYGPIFEAVAILHDVVEDNEEITLEYLSELFPGLVVIAVDALTRRDDESYDDFIERVRLDSIARRVKIADIEDNLSDLSPDHRKHPISTKALERLKSEQSESRCNC